MDGNNIVIYDNLQSVLQSPRLALALTAPSWKDRILGSSQTITVPQRCTWVATGNNIRLGCDLPRRCYWIRLNSQMSRPWTRTGFRHADLIGWVREHRGKLLVALLTIARAWFAAGQPAAPVPAFGSFENWARVVAGILWHAGVRGFLGNMQEFYDLADDGTPQWESFLVALHTEYCEDSFSVAELSRQLQSDSSLREVLREELSGAWGEKEAPSDRFKVKLGKAFRIRLGTRFGNDGLHLERAGQESKGKQVRWKVVRAGMQGSQGSSRSSAETANSCADQQLTDSSLLNLQPCNEAGETPIAITPIGRGEHDE